MQFFFATVIFFLLSVGSGASGRELFVNNLHGDDGATGQYPQSTPDRAGPVRTITKALRLALPGDRIVLAKTEAPYRESITFSGSRHSGSALRPFTLLGNGATLDGSAPVPADAWEHVAGAVFRFQPRRVAHQQLFMNDRPAPRVIAGPSDETLPALKPLEWCLYRGHVYFCVEPTKLPADYPLSYTLRPVGITLFHVDRVTIENLTIQGFQLDGVNAANNARWVNLIGLTCRGNGRSGITVGGASLVDIEACLLGNNGRAQLLTLPFSETHVRRSELLSNTAPGWVDEGGRVYIDGKRLEGGLASAVAGARGSMMP